MVILIPAIWSLSSCQTRYITYLFVSVVLTCLVLYLKKTILSNNCILYCLVLLNDIPFLNLVCFYLPYGYEKKSGASLMVTPNS